MQEEIDAQTGTVSLEALRRALAAARRALPAPLPEDLREQLVSRLLGASAAQRAMIGSNLNSAQRPEILEILAERAHAWRHIDPATGLEIAITATDLSDSLVPAHPLSVLIEDARANAWAVRANLERCLEKYSEAELSWSRARARREAGSGDALLHAQHSFLEASLRRDQRRFSEARSLLTFALDTFRQLDEKHRLAETFVKLATVLHEEGDDELALLTASRAGDEISVAADPTLAAGLLFNSILYGVELGDKRVAYQLFSQAQWFFDAYLPPNARLLVLSRRGELARELGEFPVAIHCFDLARRGYAERDLAYDAALSALELATTLLKANMPSRARELAEEMLPVFLSKQIPREASAALLVYVHSARQQGLSATLLEQVMFDFKRLYQRDASASFSTK